MPHYQFIAKDPQANRVTGRITAASTQDAVAQLRQRDLIVISLDVMEEKAKGFHFRRQRIKKEDLVVFTRQLATMVDAGIPILQCLDTLLEQFDNVALKAVIQGLREDIHAGNALATAFAKYPQIFDSLYVNMIKVGETGGVLSSVLERIASHLEKSIRLERKIKSALVYPAVVTVIAILITTVLLIKVVPTFAEIYESMDHELPALTQLLISISEFVKQTIVYWLMAVILIGFGLRRWYQTSRGRWILDRAVLRVPIFGPLIHKVVMSRFSRTLSTLLQAGVPILESLDIVAKTTGNRVVELVIEDVKNHVREGENISVPLSRSDVFPPLVVRMIAVGESSGQMEKMLTKIAEFYDDQVDAAVAALTSIIEPVIIGFLGVVVGFIVIALFMPIINITQVIQ